MSDYVPVKVKGVYFVSTITGSGGVIVASGTLSLSGANTFTGNTSLTGGILSLASAGALGGGALTLINPGEEVVLRWKAIKPGVFVYHCAPGDVMKLAALVPGKELCVVSIAPFAITTPLPTRALCPT